MDGFTEDDRMIELCPCPFCNSDDCEESSYGDSEIFTGQVWYIHCWDCGYHSAECKTEEEAVAAHNRLCNAVTAGLQESNLRQV